MDVAEAMQFGAHAVECLQELRTAGIVSTWGAEIQVTKRRAMRHDDIDVCILGIWNRDTVPPRTDDGLAWFAEIWKLAHQMWWIPSIFVLGIIERPIVD